SEVADHEARAELLHALALRGEAGFEAVNTLNRVRNDLSDPALAYLALTLARIERPALAGEGLDLLARRAKEEPAGPGREPRRWWSGGRRQSGASGPVESTALAALSFARVRPRTPELERAVDWLLAHRTGTDWRPHRATGPALAALAAYYVGAQAAGD